MSETRFDALRGEWIAFASHRQDRTYLPPEDHCPLCPTKDPEVPTEIAQSAFDIVVFDNKFPAFSHIPPPVRTESSSGFGVRPSAGACEVIVYSDDHHLALAEMNLRRIKAIVEVWADRYRVLGARDEIDFVFIFENKGVEVGVTLHHPHGQIYGYPFIPPVPARELALNKEAVLAGRPCIFCAQVEMEGADGRRIVAANGDFLAFVPFAARFPYEVHISSIRHAPSIEDLSESERLSFASILRKVIRGYDRIFDFEMPYVMAMHQAPTDGGRWGPVSHFHVEFYPPYRTRQKLKYLAGSELGAGAFLNDTLPEETGRELKLAAERGESGGC